MAIFGYFPGNLNIEKLMNVNMTFVFGSAIMFVISFIAGFGQELLTRENQDSVNLRINPLEGETA